jgi:hydrogenase maturation protease
MSRSLVDRIADAALYEGYILYPYRPSVKNCQRWTFGGLLPEAYCQVHDPTERWSNQAECLVHGDPKGFFTATARFLHLTARTVGELETPLQEWPCQGEPIFSRVEAPRVDDNSFHAWQEAEERVVAIETAKLGELLNAPRRVPIAVPFKRWLEPLRETTGKIVGVLVREQQPLRGSIEVSAIRVATDLHRITVRVVNETAWEDKPGAKREDAMLRALVSAHTEMRIEGGEFVSLLDPPDEWREAAAGCQNVGLWPVLVGDAGQKDTMLASPIILYDNPQVAPESPGDLFDATEIDEILTLRILTLTDEEKQAAAGLDERAREVLQRSEGLTREQFYRLHGTMRTIGQS